MPLNLSPFREPRGVMRILQFIFAICAFSTISGYSGEVQVTVCDQQKLPIEFSYPFVLSDIPAAEYTCKGPAGPPTPKPTVPQKVSLFGDFSSDSQFFVASGVLAFLYCIGIVVVYGLFDELYQSNSLLPLVDFVLTTVLAVLWLSSSAAWANSLTALKTVTEFSVIRSKNPDIVAASTGSFSSLNISVLLGFLNFFLWASDLWFLYKETHWFKMRQESAGGV